MSDALAVEYNAEFRQAIELALRVALQKTQEDIEDSVEVPEPLLAIMGETYILLNHIDALDDEIARLERHVSLLTAAVERADSIGWHYKYASPADMANGLAMLHKLTTDVLGDKSLAAESAVIEEERVNTKEADNEDF